MSANPIPNEKILEVFSCIIQEVHRAFFSFVASVQRVDKLAPLLALPNFFRPCRPLLGILQPASTAFAALQMYA